MRGRRLAKTVNTRVENGRQNLTMQENELQSAREDTYSSPCRESSYDTFPIDELTAKPP